MCASVFSVERVEGVVQRASVLSQISFGHFEFYPDISVSNPVCPLNKSGYDLCKINGLLASVYITATFLTKPAKSSFHIQCRTHHVTPCGSKKDSCKL